MIVMAMVVGVVIVMMIIEMGMCGVQWSHEYAREPSEEKSRI